MVGVCVRVGVGVSGSRQHVGTNDRITICFPFFPHLPVFVLFCFVVVVVFLLLLLL